MFYLRLVSFVCTLASLQLLSPSLSHAQIPENCNVLFIICDDLNDFEGVFGGHPQAKTPHMDALAASGVTFINTHSNAPICGPSRSSFVTGIYPHTSNNYAFENWYNPGRSGWFQNPILQNSKTIMHYMRDNGYQSYGTGKIMHHDLADNYVYPAGHPEAGQLQTDWDDYGAKAHYGPMAYDPGSSTVVNHPKVPQSFFEGAGSLNSLFGSLADVPTINGYTGWWETGWGNNPFHYVNDNNRDDMQDELVRKWAVNKLNAIGPNEKFFMMVGFHNPHTPLVAPQSYFDLYPLESLQLPARIENDIADTYFRNNAKPDTSTLKVYRSMLNSVGEVTADGTVYATEEALLKEYLQAYLACVSFVDAQIGALIDALDNSSHAANTIVVLTSDHGYEFGEKEALSKNTLWENSTRVPLVIRVPGLASSAGQQVDEPVGLIDLFPTIRDLCGLTSDTKKNAQGAELDGHSLRPLLENPIAGLWQGPDVALSMVSTENSDDRLSKNFAVRSKDWRYIRYANGQEELYDLVNDPYEFTNLIDSSDADVLAQKGFLTNALFDLVPDLATAGRNKIVDPGFEWFTEASEPNPIPTVTENRAVDPVWFTSEPSSNLWQITRENSLQRSGNYALRFQQRWTSSPVIQLLEDRLNSNLTYALSFWLRRGNNNISPLGSNDTTVDIELWSSATVDGTFTYRADLITAAQNSVANIWQRFEGSLDAAALAAYDGDYLQLRIVRNDNVKHTIYLDDLVLNAYQAGSFEQWAHDNGLNPSAIAHDLDVDQRTNFVEYALGGNPADPTSGPHEVSIEASETAVNFIYPRRKNSTANYMVETTTDLNATWVEGGAIELPVTESFDADFDKVVNRISVDAAKRFARLKVQSQ
jgi:arylsulfatase A-like enzyme